MREDEATSAPDADFQDDDPFLTRFLPGPSAGMRLLRAQVHHLNGEDNRDLIRFILLTGESGSGKYRVAQALAGHARWKKSEREPTESLSEYAKRLGELLLTALPDSTAERELFGHVKGAFTGAEESKPGLFTDDEFDHLLLEEIGDASLAIQGKLLSVLEGRPFTPIGAAGKERNKKCDKRIIMATRQDLLALVRAGRFRDDLYNRIVRRTLCVPPLRENVDSIPDIARNLIDERCPPGLKRKLGGFPVLSEKDILWAKAQAWPRNVRELGDLVEDWLSGGAREPLETVARRLRGTRATVDGPPHELESVRQLVRETIEGILEGIRTPPGDGQVNDLITSFIRPTEHVVRAEILAWYERSAGKDREEKCRRLFPGMKWDSIVATFSKLRSSMGGDR